MLLLLAEYLQQFYKGFAVFQYLSLRGILGVLTALSLALWLGPWMIRTLQIRQIGQAVRNDGPQSHLSKSGTPTMGGALILSAIGISTLLWADLTNRYVWVVLIVTLLFGAIGWVDDYRKVIEKNSRGLPSRWKYFWQSVFGLGAAVFLYVTAPTSVETTLVAPIFKILTPLHLTNSLTGLVVVYTAFNVPFATFLMQSFFDGIPKDLEEAAMIDGATQFTAFRQIILPLTLPGIAATLGFVFTAAWSELLFALMLINGNDAATFPVGLLTFVGKFSVDFGQMMAAGVLALIPAGLFFLLIQRYLVQGLTAGAVKG